MMILKDTIKDYSKNIGLPILKFPERSQTQEAYTHIRKTLGDGPEMKEPPNPDFWIDLALKANEKQVWQSLRRDEIKNIALCLCHGSETRLIDNHQLLSSFLEACKSHQRKSIIRALIWVYLFQYQIDDKGIMKLGGWLSNNVIQWDWHWKDRERNLQIFSNPKAYIAIAEAVLMLSEDTPIILNSCGVGGNLQSGGMASAAFAEVLNRFKSLADSDDVQSTKDFLKKVFSWSLLGEGKFSYPKLKIIFIESLLLPWIEGKPEESIRHLIQGYLIEHFDDPRISNGKWIGVSEDAMRIIRAWLVEGALAQFLDVVDELAVDHQWKYRRAFWTAYLNKDVISDAWVVFATNGESHVRRLAQRYEDNSWLSFGRLNRYQDANHAILILKIGDITIADFSHNGKCRIWDKGNESAPALYQPSYGRGALMYGNSNSEFIHSSSDRGTWQRNVAGAISSKTGVRLSYGEYMP